MVTSDLLHPNAPQQPTGVTGVEDSTGAIDLTWDAVDGAKSYVIHASGANEDDPKDAVFMYYIEEPSYRFTPSKLQQHVPGDILRFYVQAYDELGVGADETEKAAYLHDGPFTGSAWSDVVEMTMTK
ncbi:MULTISPECIES: fibronectin type III domain-containing protein [Lactococcus]|uniref:Fibronectin type III domain-containing protein n=1 Tax=Lactococcus garvieae TaxID=1363 RepID=A0AAX3NF20_9LACT|nr:MULTISPECIES: fibronectin type III domain-containing protein [Lactococcus]WEA14883.1 fibronectin type III domain-containing protein [Lactococcus garvieae]